MKWLRLEFDKRFIIKNQLKIDCSSSLIKYYEDKDLKRKQPRTGEIASS